MLGALLVILFLLWIAGYVHIGGIVLPAFALFSVNGQTITVWNILTLLIISWAVAILPSPFREITGTFTVLWILSILGVVSFAGLSSLLIIAIMIGLVVFLIKASVGRPNEPLDS